MKAEGMTDEEIEEMMDKEEWASADTMDTDGFRTLYCGGFRELAKANDNDFDLVVGNSVEWRMQVTTFKTGKTKGDTTVYGTGTVELPEIEEPEKDDGTGDDNPDKDTAGEGEEEEANATFIGASSLAIGAFSAMLAF